MYTALSLFYQILGVLCDSYCKCMSLRDALIPAISLGFHYLYMHLDLLKYSMEEKVDSYVEHFVQECSGFFRIFSTADVISFPTVFEDCDTQCLSEEYCDILGLQSLDDLVVRVCLSS